VKFFLLIKLEKGITFTKGLAGKKNNREGFKYDAGEALNFAYT